MGRRRIADMQNLVVNEGDQNTPDDKLAMSTDGGTHPERARQRRTNDNEQIVPISSTVQEPFARRMRSSRGIY